MNAFLALKNLHTLIAAGESQTLDDLSQPKIKRFADPLPAIREALLNAVIHRNYTDGSDIQIKIFDNQISIFRPGLLYSGLKLEVLQSGRDERGGDLADICTNVTTRVTARVAGGTRFKNFAKKTY
jgi:hypothetical protein